MTAPAPVPSVARLGSPAELAAALPHLIGFVPTESVVVVSLRGPRHRVGLTLRADLPPRAHDEAVVAELVERVVASGADAALVVVCTDAADDGGALPRARLVRRLRRCLGGAGVAADDALLVRAGRWWSYVCRIPTCCPPSGTPVRTGTPGLSLVEAHAALEGRAVLPSRAALEQGLAAPTPLPPLLARLTEARAGWTAQVRAAGRPAAGRAALAAWRTAMAAGPARRPDDATAAALVASLDDDVVRDAVLVSAVDDDDALLGLLLDLARRTPSPHDAQVCALLGWTAHLRGDGATANIALDRALASDPGLRMARLSREALDTQVPPAELRSTLAGTRATLRAAYPWTAPPATGGCAPPTAPGRSGG